LLALLAGAAFEAFAAGLGAAAAGLGAAAAGLGAAAAGAAWDGLAAGAAGALALPFEAVSALLFLLLLDLLVVSGVVALDAAAGALLVVSAAAALLFLLLLVVPVVAEVSLPSVVAVVPAAALLFLLLFVVPVVDPSEAAVVPVLVLSALDFFDFFVDVELVVLPVLLLVLCACTTHGIAANSAANKNGKIRRVEKDFMGFLLALRTNVVQRAPSLSPRHRRVRRVTAILPLSPSPCQAKLHVHFYLTEGA
jgi:hypothetical protein